jgi:hypothetical protein
MRFLLTGLGIATPMLHTVQEFSHSRTGRGFRERGIGIRERYTRLTNGVGIRKWELYSRVVHFS